MGGYYTAAARKTEEYNGSSWSAGGDLSSPGKYDSTSAGTQTAGLCTGGRSEFGPVQNVTEEYDGSSWSSGGNTITARTSGAGGGTQSAAYIAGGHDGTSNFQSTEEYNGTAWSAGGNTLTRPRYRGGCEASPPIIKPAA
jgi:hypothetical protein